MFTPVGYSEKIFKERYAFTSEETWEEACLRVANQMAIAEQSSKQSHYKDKFYSILSSNKFVPGGRIWYNSGRNNPQLLNCFVLDPDKDSKEGWGKTAYNNIVTSMTGGGCGDDFSDVRPKGATIGDQRGTAPGPVELMRLVNGCASPVKAGGNRRVANMFSLDADHPDVMEFLNAKLVKGELTYANVSLRLKRTTEFIKAVNEDLMWDLHWKGKYRSQISTRDLWNTIVSNAYNSAEPGLLNWELVENESNIYYIEPLVTTNPCGEIALSAYDCCCLGHLVLTRFIRDSQIDYALLGDTIRTAVRFLDNVLTVNSYPLPEMKAKSHKLRRIGLGTTGLADTLSILGLRYGSEEALKFIDKLYKFIAKAAYESSVMLAVEKGAFPACDPSKHVQSGFMKRMPAKIRSLVAEHGIRNCALLTQAPTGCQRPDTLVSTDEGILELRELGNVEGDKWQNVNFNVHQDRHDELRPSTKFFINGYADTKKIKLSSGIVLECTNNHQYRVLKNGDYVWVRADQLEEGDLLVSKLNTYTKDTDPELESVDKIDPRENVINMPKKMSYDLSKFLGYLFADGSIHEKGIRIACNALESDYLDVKNLGEKLFGIQATLYDNKRNCLSVCFNSKMLLRWLAKNNLIKQDSTKVEIPKLIRQSSRTSIQGFIDGYWEADGSISIDNRHNSQTKYIDTVSEKMAQQLVVISRALGQECAIQERVSGMGSLMYRVKFIKTKRRIETKEITQQLETLGLSNTTVDSVVSIEDSFNLTLDIEVPQTTTYIANGIVSHNTVSILSGNCSSGIEPMFAPAYERRYWVGDKREVELVMHPLFEQFMREGRDVSHFIASRELSVRDHMEVQATVQKWVDNAVSKTINIPEDYPLEEVSKLWLEYLPRLKGTTFYRENTRGYVDEFGKVHEPPLKAIPLSEAIERFKEIHKTEAVEVNDCAKGSCELK